MVPAPTSCSQQGQLLGQNRLVQLGLRSPQVQRLNNVGSLCHCLTVFMGKIFFIQPELNFEMSLFVACPGTTHCSRLPGSFSLTPSWSFGWRCWGLYCNKAFLHFCSWKIATLLKYWKALPPATILASYLLIFHMDFGGTYPWHP